MNSAEELFLELKRLWGTDCPDAKQLRDCSAGRRGVMRSLELFNERRGLLEQVK
jgi:hypothetical protein